MDEESVRVEDWGRTAYRAALERQLETLRERRDGRRPDTLVLTEHDPVFTVGRRRGAAGHLTADPAFLERHGIEVAETNRGGDITYHGPGQITGYLFVDLSRDRDLHRLLRRVEDLLIAVVSAHGLVCGRRAGLTGVWIGNRKIAAIGMAARHWISFHGFALNVSTDLTHFEGIVPCGITEGSVTSLARELERPITPDEVKPDLTARFRAEFGARTAG
ncbi:MAG: lipoyl(octanoyl) transferase LipB [Puniceicoccaceae bacterium]